jgi:hypothetical protein
VAEKNKGNKLTVILGCLGLLILLSLLACCGGGAALFLVGPGLLVGLVVSDEPLPVQVVKWDEGRVEMFEDQLATEMLSDRTIELTGDELTQLVISEDTGQLVAFRIDIDDQERGVLDMSVQLDPSQPQYFNMHAVGDFEIEDGWFTEFTVDTLDIGKFDIGQYVAGQQLKDNVNQSLAQQRVQDPEVGQAFDMIELLTIEDGQFVLTLTDEGVTQLQADGKI